VIVSHVCDDAAVQLQPCGAATLIDVAAPPAAGIVCDGGVIDVLHDPVCDTVCVWPPIVMVPVRLLPVFAVTLNVTLPLPEPDAPPVIVIQGVEVDAVHAQPAGAVAATADPFPAVEATCWEEGLIESDTRQEPA
jgi:hypothetical protein